MKKVLILKPSSLGDVIHTLPALTDAGRALPGIRFDWVVEEAFSEVPAWHPLVDKVIPVALRRWRRNPLHSLFSQDMKAFWKKLRHEKYEAIIDAQGLIKSAILTRFSRGFRIGLNKESLTESLARFAYQKTVPVDLSKHAVWRMRAIFANALNYAMPEDEPDADISSIDFPYDAWDRDQYIVFLHGTTWPTKKWPDSHWLLLSQKIAELGYRVRVPWSNERECEMVDGLAKESDAIDRLPGMDLAHLAGIIQHAKAVVAVDTGLGHLSAALNIPTISLYGPTDPARVGTAGKNQIHLRARMNCVGCDHSICRIARRSTFAACLKDITPERVFEQLQQNITVFKR